MHTALVSIILFRPLVAFSGWHTALSPSATASQCNLLATVVCLTTRHPPLNLQYPRHLRHIIHGPKGGKARKLGRGSFDPPREGMRVAGGDAARREAAEDMLHYNFTGRQDL